MKVAIYCRVSTDEQTEKNQSIVLEQWAKDKGWEVNGLYQETGSAWQHADQKELHRLINDCRTSSTKCVLVYELSRLSRQGTLATLLVVKQLANYGVEVRSYRESWLEQFTNPALRESFIGFLGYINEDASKQISDRTKLGMSRAKGEGKHIGRPRKKGIADN